MSKKSNLPAWVKAYYAGQTRQPTTGTRECQECFAPAYSHHAANCPKVR